MKTPSKRWSIRNSMMLGAVAAVVSVLFNLDKYESRGTAYLVGGFFGAVIGGAFLCALVAGLRNRMVFGKQARN